mgnify:FL=1
MIFVDSVPTHSVRIAAVMILTVLLKFALAAVDDVSEAKLSKLSGEGNKKAADALRLIEKAGRVSNSLRMVTVFAEMLTAAMAVQLIFDVLGNGGGWVLPVVLAALSLVIWVAGIIVPQRLASDRAEKMMFSLMWLINIMYYVCFPFERALSAVVNVLLKPLGVETEEDSDDDITEEEIRYMVDAGSESGAIEQDEKEMIHNIFELNDTPVKDIMTHRTDVIFLWKEESVGEWEKTVSENEHTIYPVCGETVDDIVGTVKAADFYRYLRNNENNAGGGIDGIIMNAFLVPESIKADELFRQMQQNKSHFAVVLDEYGGLAGIITISDLLEEIVGDLDNDSEDDEEADIVQLDANTWRIKGSVDIELVSETLGVDLPIEDYNTFAGMILAELGAVPDDGATAELEIYGLQIKVTKVKEHRIEEAIVCKIMEQ